MKTALAKITLKLLLISNLVSVSFGQCNPASSSTPFLLVSQSFNGHSYIRQLYVASPTGTVNTVAGMGTIGYYDQTTGTSAKLSRPIGLAAAKTGLYVYIADSTNYCVRRMGVGGKWPVTTLCGVCTVQGSTDGSASVAKFDPVQDVSLTDDNLFLYISTKQKLRVYDFTTAKVSTLAGSGTDGCGTGTGTAVAMTFTDIKAIASSDHVLAIGTTVIYRISRTSGAVEIIAGACGVAAYANGVGTSARFIALRGIAMTDDESKFYTFDTGAFNIRKITYPQMVVTTYTGASGANTYVNGGLSSLATFGYNTGMGTGLAMNPATNDEIYITGDEKVRILIISLSVARTFSGTGVSGDNDGAYNVATFRSPASLVYYSCPVICPAGNYGRYMCTVCAIGTYNSVTSMSACQQCTAGNYASATGATVCVKCALGSFVSTTGASASTACAVGSYAPVTGLSVCTKCAVGSYIPSTGASASTICAVGKYTSTTGASTCTVCNAGSYTSITGSSVCQNCQGGTYSSLTGVTSSSSCQNCTAGYYAPSGSSKCLQCAPSFISSNGATTCTLDPNALCPPGYKGLPGSCVTCSTGTYSTFTGALVCQNCSMGRFASASGSTGCVNCSAGSYASIAGSSVCRNCIAGAFSTSTGASNASVCQTCIIGSFASAPAASSCDDCAAGSYASLVGSSICQTCMPGAYSTSSRASGVSACQACMPGSYSTSAGASDVSTCQACMPGSYSTSAGASDVSTCQGCMAGTYSTSNGASDVSACQSCYAGSYSTSTGASDNSVCQGCIMGSFASAYGASSCAYCVAGSYTSTDGSSGCQACTAGTYASFTGASDALDCQSCTGGTYSTSTGASDASVCQNCSAGNYSLSGATKCLNCDNGFTSLEASSVCTLIPPCPLGSYGTTPSCNPCPANTNSSTNHTSTLLDCRCLPGYVCTYTKRINLRLTLLNITWDMLDVAGLANSRVIDAIAAAAGVSRDHVAITGIVAGTPARRMMREAEPRFKPTHPPLANATDSNTVSIWATVMGASSLDGALAATLLDPYLVDSFSWTHGHSVRVAREWGSLQ